MPAAPLPKNEANRLTALISCEVLDTEREDRFDELTRLAAEVCETPMSALSLIDTDRQWFKSTFGIDAEQTPRSQAFCAYTILGHESLIITDAEIDQRVNDNPLVTAGLGIAFYAGVPLTLSTGEAIGALCVIDTEPRFLIREQLETLQTLAQCAIVQLELNRSRARVRQDVEQAHRAMTKMRAAIMDPSTDN